MREPLTAAERLALEARFTHHACRRLVNVNQDYCDTHGDYVPLLAALLNATREDLAVAYAALAGSSPAAEAETCQHPAIHTWPTGGSIPGGEIRVCPDCSDRFEHVVEESEGCWWEAIPGAGGVSDSSEDGTRNETRAAACACVLPFNGTGADWDESKCPVHGPGSSVTGEAPS